MARIFSFLSLGLNSLLTGKQSGSSPGGFSSGFSSGFDGGG